MKRVLLLYIPVLHAGYLKLFEKYKNDVAALAILGAPFLDAFSPFHKEIRAMEPETVRKLVESLKLFPSVSVVTEETLAQMADAEIITADEEVSRAFVEKYFPKNPVTYDTAFLRWDKKKLLTRTDVRYDRISTDSFDREMIARAQAEAEKSSDWWRQVGGAVVKDGKVLFQEHNRHVPSEHTQYANGDPRDVVEAGTHNELYTSIHVEQAVIAYAAKAGVSLEGASMYLNIFPCPLCAKLLAAAGIKKCFFATGAAWLDAESILKANGVEIVFVRA